MKMFGKSTAMVFGAALVSLSCAALAAQQALSVTSSFSNGQPVPKEYSGQGADHSPPLRWSPAPSNTKSIAVVCLDPDAPGGTWYHWFLYNLSPTAISLGENVPKAETITGGAMQGINDFKKVGYNGPMPPWGQKHRYEYRVFALDQMLPLKPGARKDEILRAINGHVVAQGAVTGSFQR